MSLSLPATLATGAASLVGAKGAGLFNMVAQGAIAEKELVALRDNNRVVACKASLGLARDNNQTFLSALKVSAKRGFVPSTGMIYDSPSQHQCILTDGSIARVFVSGNVSTPGTKLSILIIDPETAAVIYKTDVTIANYNYPAANTTIWALPNNRMVVGYASTPDGGTTQPIKYLILDAQLNTIATATIAATFIGALTTGLWTMAVLANGDIFFAGIIAGNLLRGVRYNSAGVLQGGVFSISEVVFSTGFSLHLLPNANGDWTLLHLQNNQTTTYRWRGNGNTVNITASHDVSPLFSGSPSKGFAGFHQHRNIREMPNGKILFLCMDNANIPGAYVYGADLSYQTKVSPAANYSNQTIPDVCIHPDNSFTIAYPAQVAGNYDVALIWYNADLTIRASGSFGFVNGTGQAYQAFAYALHYVPGSGFTIPVHFKGGSSSGRYAISQATEALVAKGNVFNIDSLESNDADRRGVELSISRDSALFTYQARTDQDALSLGTFRLYKSAIFGVAQKSAADGEIVSVATIGTFDLPTVKQTYPYVPSTFDARAFVPPGNKGTVLGNTAVLQGVLA